MAFDPLLSVAVVYTVCWCFLHSLFLSDGFGHWLRPLFGTAWRWHRVVYNIVATITLLPLLLIVHLINEPPLFSWSGSISIIRFLLLTTALLLFCSGSRMYDFKRFIGLEQLRSGETSVLLTGNSLQKAGILGLVRHPWYSGGILLIWSIRAEYGMSVCLIYTVFTLYLIIGAFLEERRLMKIFGVEYRAYREEVSMFFPLKWLRKRSAGIKK